MIKNRNCKKSRVGAILLFFAASFLLLVFGYLGMCGSAYIVEDGFVRISLILTIWDNRIPIGCLGAWIAMIVFCFLEREGRKW